jgi:effector-binding domain-containing protein
MKVFLTSKTFDVNGYVPITPTTDKADFGESRRRASRVQTLDGGIAVNDFGYADGDRTITLYWRPRSAAVEANIKRLVEQYQRLNLSTKDGFYEVIPESYNGKATESKMILLVTSRKDL